MKIVVLDKPRENPGEIDWSQVEKLGDARIYDVTPHISWAALDCRRRLIRLAVENVKAYLAGNPINIVNK